MSGMKRVFIIVLDSFGIGELPDAADYGDQGSDTLGAVKKSPFFQMEKMKRLGLFQIEGCGKDRDPGQPVPVFQGAVARMEEQSRGKDTTIGHWEIAGVVSEAPLPVFPEGFPEELLERLRERTGRGILCNRPYSGTEVIRDYGREHLRTGDLIVYTSADSVLQIAAHEDLVPPELLYQYCQAAREICQGPWGVGRIIARPFIGSWPDFTRTANRHDFSLEPPAPTMLDLLKEAGKNVISRGKIVDIFAGRGITEYVRTENNADGIEKTLKYMEKDFEGLCFTNLVDFDMLYGHRNDRDGYAKALAYFDSMLPRLEAAMRDEDILIITADHGCDPDTPSTDHSREYTPLIVTGKQCLKGVNLGTRQSFADIAASVLDYLGVKQNCRGVSFYPQIRALNVERLAETAIQARQQSYAPYSHFCVGAALLSEEGEVYSGCNVENAAYGPSVCAERTAFVKAVSEGKRRFRAIAIAGGPQGDQPSDYCAPCGVCRQVMEEFCGPDFLIILAKSRTDYQIRTLKELLPEGFGPGSLGSRKESAVK